MNWQGRAFKESGTWKVIAVTDDTVTDTAGVARQKYRVEATGRTQAEAETNAAAAAQDIVDAAATPDAARPIVNFTTT